MLICSIDRNPKNCCREIIQYTFSLPIEISSSSIPFSIPVPSNLPPTVDADSGSNRYAVTATVEGPNQARDLTTEASILIYSTSAATNIRSRERVEGLCYDKKVQYAWTAEEQAPIGTQFNTSISLAPLPPSILSVGILNIALEETTVCGISAIAKTAVVKRWSLTKLQPTNHNKLLPWTGNTGCSQADASLLSAGVAHHECEQSLSKSKSTSLRDTESNVRSQLATTTGPWGLSFKLTVPSCSHVPINNTIQHPESVVQVSHRLVLQIQFRDIDGISTGIELMRPFKVLSSHYAEPGSALPCYYCDCYIDHPYEDDQKWRQLARQEDSSPTSSKVLPSWLLKMTSNLWKSKEDEDYLQDKPPIGSSQMWLDLSSQSKSSNATLS
jgi:hypothetical protein